MHEIKTRITTSDKVSLGLGPIEVRILTSSCARLGTSIWEHLSGKIYLGTSIWEHLSGTKTGISSGGRAGWLVDPRIKVLMRINEDHLPRPSQRDDYLGSMLWGNRRESLEKTYNLLTSELWFLKLLFSVYGMLWWLSVSPESPF